MAWEVYLMLKGDGRIEVEQVEEEEEEEEEEEVAKLEAADRPPSQWKVMLKEPWEP